MSSKKTIATMKNLFKNLMLVAVAAMAFVACQNEPEMVINGGEKTTITFDAKFDDTRSYFGEKDGDAYPSFWTGNEVAAFNHWTVENGNYESVNATIDAEDRFLVEFGRPIDNTHVINAYVPASAWGDVKNEYELDAEYNFFYTDVYREYSIPAEQTPTATSVDEKAHILKATVAYAGSDSVELVFQHQVAYGRFSVKNLALEADDAVVSAVLNINGKSYTVNTDASTDVWFACAPATVEIMTIALNTEGGVAYTKTLVENSDKTLAFVQGQVSAFTVNMEGVGTGEVVEVFEPNYLMDALAWDSSNGRFKMTGESLPYPNNDYVAFYLNGEDCTTTSINPGVYTGNGDGSNSNTNPAKGQFAGRMSLNWGTVTYPKAFTSASTLTVSFENDVYTVVLDYNGTTYGYKGMPEGWTAPGVVKTKLATPSVRATAEGNVVTIDFDYIEGAGSYTISGLDQTYTVTGTTSVYELAYSTTYNISVVANPANAETHKASDAGTATVTTEADPNAEPEQPEQPGDAVAITKLSLPGNNGQSLSFNDGALTMSLVWPVYYSPNGTYSLVAGSSSDKTTAHSIMVDGVAATSVSGTITVDYQQYGQYLFVVTFNDVVIDGVSYTGSASTPL